MEMIRRHQRTVERLLLNMSLALVDIIKLVPVVSAKVHTVVATVSLNAALRDTVNSILRRGVTIPILPLDEDTAKPFPREITLSGDIETAYQRCVEGGDEADDTEVMLRHIYCGYALLTLISNIGMSRVPSTSVM